MTPLTPIRNLDTLPSLRDQWGLDMGSIYRAKEGLWCVAVYWQGKRYLIYKDKEGQALDSPKRAAITLALIEGQINRKDFNPSDWGKERPFLFEQASDIWLERKNVTLETLKSRERILKHHLLPHWKGKDIREIRSIHLEAFVVHLKKKGLSDKSIYNIMGELRACLRFHSESLPRVPTFPTITFQEPEIHWLTGEQQDKVFEEISEEDRPIFTFQRWTGCRPNEARGLIRENVHRDKGIVVISSVIDSSGALRHTTKTKRIRVLPIIPEIEDAIRPREVSKFVFTRKGEPYSKRTQERIWNEAMKRANKKHGIPIVSMYPGTKHSLGMQRLNQGVSREVLKRLFGHTDEKSTERYAKYLTESLAPAMRGNVVNLTNISRNDVSAGND